MVVDVNNQWSRRQITYFIIALIPIYPSILVLLISNINHDISVYAPWCTSTSYLQAPVRMPPNPAVMRSWPT